MGPPNLDKSALHQGVEHVLFGKVGPLFLDRLKDQKPHSR